MSRVVRTETRQRSFAGKVIKWLFIAFNLLMIFWLFSYWGFLGEAFDNTSNEYEQAGAAIGATIGTSAIVFFWAAGDVILGLLVLFTRGKKTIVEEIEG